MLRRTDRALLAVMGLSTCLPAAAWVLRKALPGRPGVAFNLVEGPGLHGMETALPRPPLTASSWFGGALQGWLGNSFEVRYGFRGRMVRAANQIDLALFNASRMYDGTILVGRDGSLFEQVYLEDACRQREPIPDGDLDKLVRDLERAGDLLRARRIPFVLLVTPHKAAIYPEDMPDDYRRAARPGPRNYDRFVARLAGSRVAYVDGHRITLAAKAAAEVPLFPRGGTHWQSLCAFETTAALTDALRAQGAPLHRLRVGERVIDNRPTGTDRDLLDLMNLAYPPDDYPVPHPQFLSADDLPPLSRAVFVGGSFAEAPQEILTRNGVFARTEFHCYTSLGRNTYGPEGLTEGPGRRGGWGPELDGAAAVVLEINERLDRVGPDTHFGMFLDDLFAGR